MTRRGPAASIATMWFAILGGLAVGVVLLMFIVLRQERGYRVLFSDTHLASLAKAIARARTSAPTATFEGVQVGWERMPKHVALVFTVKRPVAPAAARFLLAFAIELAGKIETVATLQLDKRRFAIVWETGAIDAIVIDGELDDAALARLRAGAADVMQSVPLTEADLVAFR